MREIKYIVIHCTGTPHNTKIEVIKKYWREVLKWRYPGYHCIIDAKGVQHWIWPIGKIANGVKGHNKHAVHVAYIGGEHKDDRTTEQKISLIYAIKHLKDIFPTAKILGHRDFLTPGTPTWKDCPQFDAKEEYKDL